MITQSQFICITGASLAGLVGFACLSRKQPQPSVAESPVKFTTETITQRFTASLPELCPVLNLELGLCKQVETFIETSERRALWGIVNLGTSVAQITVPVSYRFHVRVRDAWKLETVGNLSYVA